MGIARKEGRGWGVKACQDGLGHFYAMFARLTEVGGGESKAILAMPI